MNPQVNPRNRQRMNQVNRIMFDRILLNPPLGSTPLMNPAARRHLLFILAPPQPDFEGSVYELLVALRRLNSMLRLMLPLKRPTPMVLSLTMIAATNRSQIRATNLLTGSLCPTLEETLN